MWWLTYWSGGVLRWLLLLLLQQQIGIALRPRTMLLLRRAARAVRDNVVLDTAAAVGRGSSVSKQVVDGPP